MDLVDKMHRVAFLGPEFLTWLWFRSATGDGEFALDPEWGDFELWFEDKLVVGSAAVNAQENLFKGGHPADSLEARTALRLGKLATEARLRIVRGAQEWSFVLRSHDLAATGIKIPAVLSKEADDKFYERMYLLEQLDTMLKGLFGVFLKIRLGDRWTDDELPTIQRWIAGDDVEPTRIDPAAMGIRAVEVKAPAPDPDAPAKVWPPLAEDDPLGAIAAGEIPRPELDDVPPWDALPPVGGGGPDETGDAPPPAGDEGAGPDDAAPSGDPAAADPAAADPADAAAAPEALDPAPALDDDVPPWEADVGGDTPPWEAAPDEED